MTTHPDLTFVIAGDDPTTRKALKALLEGNGFQVLGEASNGDEAVCMASELKPDIAVLDVCLPVPNGLEAARSIKINHSHIKMIILTGYATGPHLLQCLAIGASAYIAMNKTASCLLDGIHAVNAGDIYVRLASNDYLNAIACSAPESLQDLIVRAQKVLEARNGTDAIVKLSRREGEVLDCVLRALANKEIAFELNLTERTVKFHVSRLLAKFKVHSRMDLIREASLQPIRFLPRALSASTKGFSGAAA